MSLDRHRTEIEAAFMAGIEAFDSEIELIGENSSEPSVKEKEWIRMSLTILDSNQKCINNDGEETIGIFNVQVFTPLAQGASRASKIVDEAKRILRGSNLNAISFLSTDITTGRKEDGWFNILLRARYRAYD